MPPKTCFETHPKRALRRVVARPRPFVVLREGREERLQQGRKHGGTVRLAWSGSDVLGRWVTDDLIRTRVV